MKIFSPTISGSSQTSGSLTISGSLNVSQGITGSLLGTASWAINVVNGGGGGSTNTGSLLTTASVVLNTITFTKGDGSTFPITVNTGSGGGGSVGTLAQVTALGASTTTPITASIISASSFTGSLFGTASWALSASNAINARTASFLPVGTYLITSSWATNALTASLAPNYVLTSTTSSMLAPYTLNSQTSSFVKNSQTSSMSVLSSSFATTASFASNGGVTQITAGTGISINQSTGNVTITNTGGGGGATFPYTGSAIISGSLIVTGSTNSSGGFTGSLLGTASHAITASYALSSAGGGGSFSLAGATDVSFSALTDGDLIRYNGIAGKWQNTNLGLSLTPSLSAIEGGYFGGYVTITNWGSYSSPTAQAFIKSGSSIIITCSVNSSGLITWNDSNSNYNFTRSLEVQVQDFGDLASEIITASYVKQTASFRYYRWFAVSASSNVLLNDFRFYSGSSQTSTAFPANMTNSGSPAPYVASASSFYVGYPAWQAFDNSTITQWWNLGSPPYQGAFVSIDMGATFTSSLRSMRIQFGSGFQNFTVANIQGSDDNTTWTTIHTITNVPSDNNALARNFG